MPRSARLDRGEVAEEADDVGQPAAVVQLDDATERVLHEGAALPTA